MFWQRRRRDPLAEMASGAAQYVLSESTRLALEKIATEWVKEDLAYIRGPLYRQMREAYQRRCAELFGPSAGVPR